MNTSLSALARALRGPVLLATFGLLLALSNLADFRFRYSWPILVIVYGVMRLAEALLPKAPQSGPVPPGAQGGAF
jgi:hypothetical protein